MARSTGYEEIEDPTDKRRKVKRTRATADGREKIQKRERAPTTPYVYASGSHKYARSILSSLGERE